MGGAIQQVAHSVFDLGEEQEVLDVRSPVLQFGETRHFAESILARASSTVLELPGLMVFPAVTPFSRRRRCDSP
jgi:hypothetical protein